MVMQLRPFSRATSVAPAPISIRRAASRMLKTNMLVPMRSKCAALPPSLEKWAPLAVDGDGRNKTSCLTADPDYRQNLDDLCTRFLRAALKGDVDALKPCSSWADDVSALGNYCVAQKPEPHIDGARFAFFLLEVAANRWPKEADDLVGVYKDAAEKIHGVLENSGWRLALPGEKEGVDSGVASGYDSE